MISKEANRVLTVKDTTRLLVNTASEVASDNADKPDEYLGMTTTILTAALTLWLANVPDNARDGLMAIVLEEIPNGVHKMSKARKEREAREAEASKSQ